MALASSGAGTWLRRYHASPQAAVRLVCFPFAGGSASYYFPFSQLLAPGIEVLAVQYPGRQDRHHEPCVDTVPELAGGIFAGLRAETPAGDDRPLVLFGHSLGAVLAFEVALRLQRATGRPPAHLFLSGGRVQPYRTAGVADDAGLLAELRTMGGTDDRLFDSAELQAMVLPAVRADYRAIARYVPPGGGARVDCPITALIGDADPRTTPREAAGWGACTTAGFDLRVFPGGHFYLDNCRAAVLDVITSTLRGLPGAARNAPEGARHAL